MGETVCFLTSCFLGFRGKGTFVDWARPENPAFDLQTGRTGTTASSPRLLTSNSGLKQSLGSRHKSPETDIRIRTLPPALLPPARLSGNHHRHVGGIIARERCS